MILNIPKTQRSWVAAVVIGVALIVAYSNSFRGPFIFDDNGSVHENETIKKFSTAFFPAGNSGNTVSGRPVLNFTLAINYVLNGENVTGYHVFNLVVHFCSALALFGFVRRALLLPRLRDDFGPTSWWLALAVSLLWALHPLQTESVTYIVQRAESLVGLFFWLTLYFTVRVAEEPQRIRWQVAAVVACLFGMGSKEVMAGAPLVVLLFDRTFVSGSFIEAWRTRKRFYLAVASTWLLLAVCIAWTGKRGSTVGYNEFASWWRYGLTQCFAIAHYLRLVFWPHPLVLDYGQTLAYNFADASKQLYVVATLGVVTLWALWKRPKIGFLFAFFFIVLAPSSSVVPVLTQTLAEHRMYLAVGPVVALAVLLTYRLFGSRVLIAWFGVVVAFGFVTHRRNYDYRSEENIWKSVTENCPYNARGWCALSSVYSKQGDLKKAKWAVKQALVYNPKDTDAMTEYAGVLCRLKDTEEAEKVYHYALGLQPKHYGANNGLGLLLLDQGKTAEAKASFERALVERPDGPEAQFGLGKVYVELNRLEDALTAFKRVLEKDPKSVDARNNMGDALINLGRPEEAIKVLLAAQADAPDSDNVGRTLGVALLSVNRPQDAAKQFEVVLKRNPVDAKAHANLGLAYETLGRPSESCEQYEAALVGAKDLKPDMVRAVRVSVASEWVGLGQPARARVHYENASNLEPANSRLRYLLANLLLQLGEPLAAIPHYERIVIEQPGDADIHNELGVAYQQVGRFSEARRQFKSALEIQPAHEGAIRNLRNIDSSGR